MPYKISGNLGNEATVAVLNNDSTELMATTTSGAGSYEITDLWDSTVVVVATKSDGQSQAYGNVSTIPYAGDTGVFVNGYRAYAEVNTIEKITISTTGNATDFGADDIENRKNNAVTSNGSGSRVLSAGGNRALGGGHNYIYSITYFNILQGANSNDFGNLNERRQQACGTSNGTNDRGIFAGGYTTDGNYLDYIDYVTISTTGDASDFGDLTVARREMLSDSANSNATGNRGVFFGGLASSGNVNVIDYITISSTGNASDFGDLAVANQKGMSVSNRTNNRAVMKWGSSTKSLGYITITSTGNSSDFGDLTTDRDSAAGTSNGTNERGIFAGGNDWNIIDYITINTTGDATDFGDLGATWQRFGAASNA